MSEKPVCVVVGVGPGNGAAFARRFASEGYAVALLARSADLIEKLAKELPNARAYACDVTNEVSVGKVFDAIASELGDPEVLVYNAGSGVWGAIDEVSPGDFESAWKVNALGAVFASQRVIPAMKRAGRGSIIFIGATASMRGGAKAAAFASAKAAQRSLAESMARQLWPSGIHVSLVVVDGVVDLPRTRQHMPDKKDDFFIAPDGIAETVFFLTRQKPNAWSFIVEARPFGERW